MKQSMPRSVTIAYWGLLVVFAAAGCSLKESPSESLAICGNHSCGSLQMVTTDTSSDGYNYLEPSISPDGGRIIFTADWAAIPPVDHPPNPVPMTRMLALMDVPPPGDTASVHILLKESGAVPVIMRDPVKVAVGDTLWEMNPMMGMDAQKGHPSWLDGNTIVFWMHLQRGDRMFKADLRQNGSIVPEMIYYEPDDRRQSGRFWQHHDPALSPDRQWVAFTRFGSSRSNPDSIGRYTRISLWVASMTVPQLAFQVTDTTDVMGGVSWSPDGRQIAFQATLDITGAASSAFYGTEIFTVDFDTTGLAANHRVPWNRNLRRLTFTTIPEGNPIPIYNEKPVYTPDGSTILFVSDRRAPSITLHDRNIWRIPSDGSLDPVITFFSRADDIDPSFFPGDSRRIVLSSAMGFPTEMLDRYQAEAVIRIHNENPDLSDVQVRQKAASERQQLEYFARVMTHLYIYSGW